MVLLIVIQINVLLYILSLHICIVYIYIYIDIYAHPYTYTRILYVWFPQVIQIHHKTVKTLSLIFVLICFRGSIGGVFNVFGGSWSNAITDLRPISFHIHCGWKKSCITFVGWNPVNNRIFITYQLVADFFHPQ